MLVEVLEDLMIAYCVSGRFWILDTGVITSNLYFKKGILCGKNMGLNLVRILDCSPGSLLHLQISLITMMCTQSSHMWHINI